MNKSIRQQLIYILILSFLFGLGNRLVSEVLYHSLSDVEYTKYFYVMMYSELLVYSVSLCVYAFLFRMCTISKVGVASTTFLTLLDLLSVSFGYSVDFVNKYSIYIILISSILILVEICRKK